MRSPRFLPAALLAVLVSSAAGGVFGSSGAATQDELLQQYRVYTQALEAVQREYVEPIPSEQLVYASIDGLLNTLDPHSNFFKPRDYAAMRERQQGSYYGLGVTIASIDGDITIQSIFEGSPAYKRGIRRGDVIARVEGEDMKGWTTEQAVRRLKGPKGTKVNISIMGDEKQQALTLSGLQNAAGFLQRKIADRIETRYTPRLTFVIDKGVKNSLEVMRILNEVLPKKEEEQPNEEEDLPEE